MRRLVAVAALVVALTGCLHLPSLGQAWTWRTSSGSGNDLIDAGYVVDISAWCPAGTRHFAGHRSTHGSVFRNLPNLDIGDKLSLYENGGVRHYRLTSVATGVRDCDGIWGDLVLQTSHPDGGAYIFHFSRI